MNFLAGFGSILLTFLAGAEVEKAALLSILYFFPYFLLSFKVVGEEVIL